MIIENIHASSKQASVFLKSLANENRLVILCALVDGEKNVSQLEEILGIRQPTLSQQLARLRADNLVSTRRQSKQIFYNLSSDEAELVMGLVFELFCVGGPEMDLPPKRSSDEAADGAEAA
ncbi:MAG: transcriptional regulator [Rhodospirillaceae bacterium]|jgi:ArsR family transcriptional regulator|nr:transcriptional regulator [Rhodospirillaceae bacterium]|tara:strand:- start:5025 stop:5387 length:363 start_codon:yes stop_codon:yes gene_type:complete